MSNPIQGNEWILPHLHTLNLEGCTSFEWDDLKNFIESRLSTSSSSSSSATLSYPASKQMSSSFRDGNTMSSSSHHYMHQVLTETPYLGTTMLRRRTETKPSKPQKIRKLDLTKCTQVSRERMQWLKMYVPELVVKEEPRP